MKYKVVKAFADLQDNKHVYGIGDEYPRKGYSPTTERIVELSTGRNLLQKPLIQVVEEEKVVQEVVQEPEAVLQKKNDHKSESKEDSATIVESKKRGRVKK